MEHSFIELYPGFVIQGGGMTSGMVNKEGNPPIMNEANNGVKNLNGHCQWLELMILILRALNFL